MPALSLRSASRFGTGRARKALSRTQSRGSNSSSAIIIGWPAHVLGLLVGLLTQLIWHGPRENGDWAALWIAGKLLRQGDDPHIYDYAPDDFAAWAGPFWQPFAQQDVTSASPHPFVQAPFVAQMAEALTFVMSFHTSVFFLTVASGWALVVLVAIAFYVWFHRPIPMGVLVGVTLVVWLSTPFQWSITLGQTTPLVTAGIAYSIAAARRRPWSAGIALGVVSVIKLTPLALIPLMLLFRRSRRTSLIAIATTALCFGFSVLTVGWPLHEIWRARIHMFSTYKVIAPTSQTFVSIMKRHLIDEGPASAPIIQDTPGWMVVTPMMLAAVIALALGIAAYRCRGRAFEIIMVGAMCVATCFSGFVWTHYFIIVVLPAFGVFALTARRRWAVACIAMVSVLYFPPLSDVISSQHDNRYFAQTGFYVPGGALMATIVMLFLLAAAVVVPARRAASAGLPNSAPEFRAPWDAGASARRRTSTPIARRSTPRAGARSAVARWFAHANAPHSTFISGSSPRQRGHIVGRMGHIVAVLSGLVTVLAWNSHRQTDDWSSLWIAGKLVAQGDKNHIYDYNHQDFARWDGEYWAPFANEHVTSLLPHPFIQAPIVAEVMSLITRIMSYDFSTLALGFFSGWAMVITVACAYRIWVGRPIPLVLLLPVVVVAWVSAPFSMAICLGQTSPLIYAAIAYAIAAARTRPRSAGIVLGLVSVVKLSPFALIAPMFLFRRSRRTGGVAVFTTVVAFLMSLVTLGADVFRTWYRVIHDLSSARIVAVESQSFASIMLRSHLRDDTNILVPIIRNPPTWVVVVPLIMAALLAILVLAAAYVRREYAFPLFMVGITSIATACSGLVWTHYFQVAILPAFGSIVLAERRRLAGFLTIGLSLFFVPPLSDVMNSPAQARVHVQSGGLIALIGLILLMCIMALLPGSVLPPRTRSRITQWQQAHDRDDERLRSSGPSLSHRYRNDVTAPLPVVTDAPRASGGRHHVRRRHTQ